MSAATLSIIQNADFVVSNCAVLAALGGRVALSSSFLGARFPSMFEGTEGELEKAASGASRALLLRQQHKGQAAAPVRLSKHPWGCAEAGARVARVMFDKAATEPRAASLFL